VVLGLAYPLAMVGAAQTLFPTRADGEAKLVAEDYSHDAGLFQARPSVTGYAPDATFFNNLGPNQRKLARQLRGYVGEYQERERPHTPGLEASDIPADAVTTSASGIDPQISEANARIQANRVAEARGIPRERILALIDDHASGPLFGFAGDRSVNVVELNAALDREAARR
jgi:K+-transporting ATPase ATPase C chain